MKILRQKKTNVISPICDKNCSTKYCAVFKYRYMFTLSMAVASFLKNYKSQCSQQLENMPSKVCLDQSFDDPALWKINEQLPDFFAENGIKQNDNADFSKSVWQFYDKKRFMSKTVFYKETC